MARKTKGTVFRRGPLMMTCAELEAFILDYLSGRLSARQRRIFSLHMLLCRECRDYLEAYRRTVTLERAAFRTPTAPTLEDVPEDLVKAILAARSVD
jgi:anti-sigma factor RsiW